MSFSWAETITASTTTGKSSHVTELRTNINTVRSQRALGAYSWAVSISQYNVTTLTELRTAVDAAHTENYCHSYYATHNSAHQVTYYGGQT